MSACNANGQGPPLMAEKPIVARLPFDPPTAPLNASIVDVGAEYAVVSWHRPADRDVSGGRLRGYMVEKKESNTGWLEIPLVGAFIITIRWLRLLAKMHSSALS